MVRLRHCKSYLHTCKSHLQSAYLRGRSTETALQQVLDCIFTAADSRRATILVGLDISAAFDTISHQTLLRRLEAEFGVCGKVVAILPVRSDAVCLAGQPLVQQHALHVRCPSRICAGASAVHGGSAADMVSRSTASLAFAASLATYNWVSSAN